MWPSGNGHEIRYGEEGGSPQHPPVLRPYPSLLLAGRVSGIDTSLGTDNSLQLLTEIGAKMAYNQKFSGAAKGG